MFAYIDKLFMSLPDGYRSLVAVFLLLLLIFSLLRLFKGYFASIIVIIILVPGVWPALKTISKDLLLLFAYIAYRI
jgi:hypothetical protein